MASRGTPLPDAAAALLPSVECLPDVDSKDEAVRILSSLRSLSASDEPAFAALCDRVGDDDNDGGGGGLDSILTGVLSCLEQFSSDDAAIKVALGVIADVAYLPSNRRRMAEYDGLAEAVLEAVLKAMESSSPDGDEAGGGRIALRSEGCAAVANLLSRTSPEQERENKLPPDRAAAAARTVSPSISSPGDDGDVEGRVASVESGCAALHHILLASDGPSASAAAAAVALEGGCAEGIARCVNSDPDPGREVHVNAAGALCGVLRSAPALPSFVGDGAEVAEGAASAACASLLRHGKDRSVALHGLEVLDRLLGSSASSGRSSAEDRAAAAAFIAKRDGVSAVAFAMAAHPSTARVQGTGCDILAKLGSHVVEGSDEGDGGASESAVAAMLSAMKQSDYDDARLGERARESACRTLCKLLSQSTSSSSSFSSCVVRSGGVDALLCAVRDHPQNGSLLWEALEALSLLVKTSDECRVQLRGKGDVQTLLYEVSRRHPHKAGKVATNILKAM